MLTSNQDGEVVAAARKANDALKAAGLIWSDIINQATNQEIENAIVYVDVRASNLSNQDQEVFWKLREKFLGATIDKNEQKRLFYLKRYIEEQETHAQRMSVPY